MRLPQRCRVTLKYSTAKVFDPTTGALSLNVFRLASIQDPDYTGVGGQPLGHDLYTSKYRYNTVLNVHYKLEVVSNTSTIPGVTLFARPSDQASWSPSITSLNEAENLNYKRVLPGAMVRPAQLRGRINLKKWLPYPWAQRAANSGSNAPLELYLHMGIAGPNGTEDPPPCHVRITIWYDVLFHGLIERTTSD